MLWAWATTTKMGKIKRQQREKLKKERIKLSRHSTHTCELSEIPSYITSIKVKRARVESTRIVENDDNEQRRDWLKADAEEKKEKCCNSTICHFWWIASVYLTRQREAGNTQIFRGVKRAWISPDEINWLDNLSPSQRSCCVGGLLESAETTRK